jgi:membrane protein implicated in regulation of membrane protease activity
MKQHVYRSSAATLATIGCSAATAGFLAVAILSQQGQLVSAVIATIIALLTWRIWNSGIDVEPDGVKVATTFGSRRVPGTR